MYLKYSTRWQLISNQSSEMFNKISSICNPKTWLWKQNYILCLLYPITKHFVSWDIRDNCILLFSRLWIGRSLLFFIHGHTWYLNIYPSVILFILPFTLVKQYVFFLIIPYYPIFYCTLLFSFNAVSVNLLFYLLSYSEYVTCQINSFTCRYKGSHSYSIS